MSISSILNAANQAVTFARENVPTLATPSQMIRNAQKVALPAIILAGMSTAQTVDGGPIFGGWCLLACVPLVEAPPLLALCIAACGTLAIGPTP